MGQGIGFKDDDGSFGFKLTDDGKVILGNTSDDVIQVTGTLSVSGTLYAGTESPEQYHQITGRLLVDAAGTNNSELIIDGPNPNFIILNRNGSQTGKLATDGSRFTTYGGSSMLSQAYTDGGVGKIDFCSSNTQVTSGTKHKVNITASANAFRIDTDEGTNIFRVSGDTVYATEITASVNISGSGFYGDVFADNIYASNDIAFSDNNGTFPTATPGFYWDLNNDEARIYARQPASDQIDFVFKLSDNTHSVDRFMFWIDDYRGGSYDRYPIVAHGSNVLFHMTETSEGVPDTSTSKARIDSSGRLLLKAGSDPSTTADYAHVYAKDVASSAEVFVRDEAGNVTQISPHNTQGEWQYFSKNVKTGKVVRVNMEKMIKRLEQITGESFLEEWFEEPEI